MLSSALQKGQAPKDAKATVSRRSIPFGLAPFRSRIESWLPNLAQGIVFKSSRKALICKIMLANLFARTGDEALRMLPQMGTLSARRPGDALFQVARRN